MSKSSSIPTVVITGASAGIGAATARRFAKENYRLVLIARRKDKLENLRKELPNTEIAIFGLDVSSRSAVENAFTQIEKEIGPIDLLINNAGGAFGLDRAQEANLDEWEQCIDVNIKGLIYCTHTVLPHMVKRNRGHIINLGSVAGHYPYPGGNVYCGSKAFAHQFSLNLRADLLGTHLRVSCIEPGLTGGTEFSTVRFRGDETKATRVYEKTEPLQPDDIAEVIYFCASAPPHVNINTIELMPVAQAFSPLAVHRT
ncbi:MAG: SDR family NAD(P)-dependent oxidoreductase [Simkania sp.]|nr:SDR family NAD(P)-dependent oxidoreductase [Simkania sp.]